MYDFLKIQYQLGNLTEEQLRAYVFCWITEEQAKQIIAR